MLTIDEHEMLKDALIDYWGKWGRNHFDDPGSQWLKTFEGLCLNFGLAFVEGELTEVTE